MINKSVFNLKKKPKKFKSKYGYIIVAAILLALVIGYLSPKSLVAGQKVYYGLLLNILNAETNLYRKADNFFRKLETQEELQAKLNLIEPDYAKLQTLRNQFTVLAQENQELRNLLQIKNNQFSQAIIAELIQQPNDFTAKEIYISFPQDANININQAVASPQGLVGRITSIPSPGLARVLLIYDKSFQLGAQIQNTQIKGVLSGTNNPYELIFKPLAQDPQFTSNFAIGGQITTRESSPIFPNYINIGNILEAQNDSILIKPNVDFKQLKWLFILVPESHLLQQNP